MRDLDPWRPVKTRPKPGSLSHDYPATRRRDGRLPSLPATTTSIVDPRQYDRGDRVQEHPNRLPVLGLERSVLATRRVAVVPPYPPRTLAAAELVPRRQQVLALQAPRRSSPDDEQHALMEKEIHSRIHPAPGLTGLEPCVGHISAHTLVRQAVLAIGMALVDDLHADA
jgi:hypothetical protein